MSGYRFDDYKTSDEKNFIRELMIKGKTAVAEAYCNLILAGSRTWDPGVNVQELREFATETLAALKGHPSVLS